MKTRLGLGADRGAGVLSEEPGVGGGGHPRCLGEEPDASDEGRSGICRHRCRGRCAELSEMRGRELGGGVVSGGEPPQAQAAGRGDVPAVHPPAALELSHARKMARHEVDGRTDRTGFRRGHGGRSWGRG